MTLVDQLLLGFQVSLSLQNLAYCLTGVLVGTAVGVLPGLGPVAAISMLLPVTFLMPPAASIIMLAGIYYGAMYGGSITAILVRIPGEAASIVTCIDGYEMAKRGRGGAALGIAAFGSFIAGIVATVGIAVLGPVLAELALKFGSPERAALVAFGLTLVVLVGQGSPLRAALMVLAGLILSCVGLERVSGQQRFTFDIPYLYDGFNIAIMAVGLFGIAEILHTAEQSATDAKLAKASFRVVDLLPSREEWRRSAPAIGRGTPLGFLLGLLPGGGSMVASFASYVMEKKLSSQPERFGRGAIEGVAGPEAANNAAAQAGFVPLLTLGIPSNVIMGVILGALMIHGITPGPRLVTENPQLFWGVITSMFIGNLILLVLNVPLVWIFIQLLRIPVGLLSALIMAFCVVGAFSINNSLLDVAVMMVFGCIGWAMRKADLDPAPLLLGFVLGTLLETSILEGLAIGYGKASVFVTRPLSAALLGAAAFVVVVSYALPALRRWQRRNR
ncbi:MAG: tripartite tricarboxylate transporter permease [Burkholderiales bacterium]|nr:tripartite tricarboxylate transporter permease [Burkholderiales bacterium]